jgi:hypothetical protein
MRTGHGATSWVRKHDPLVVLDIEMEQRTISG